MGPLLRRGGLGLLRGKMIHCKSWLFLGDGAKCCRTATEKKDKVSKLGKIMVAWLEVRWCETDTDTNNLLNSLKKRTNYMNR